MDSSQTLRTTAPFVMLSEAKHPCAGFLTAFGTTSLVMLNEVKHPLSGFLADARNDRKSMRGMMEKRE